MSVAWHQEYTYEISSYTLQFFSVLFFKTKEVVVALLILNSDHT